MPRRQSGLIKNINLVPDSGE